MNVHLDAFRNLKLRVWADHNCSVSQHIVDDNR